MESFCRPFFRKIGVRRLTTMAKSNDHICTAMRAWQVASFDPTTLNSFCLNEDVDLPMTTQPNHVLIKVTTSAVNPIDCRMKAGYGNEYLSVLSSIEKLSATREQRLPLILGRDVCGTVIRVGPAVRDVKVGDEVFGSVAPQYQGAFAEYCVVPSAQVALKPVNVSAEEAACFPYVASTVHSALLLASVHEQNAKDFSILIHGVTGGIGSFAAQLLGRCWGARVVGTGRKDERALTVIGQLGMAEDDVVDYSEEGAFEKLCDKGPFDFVLDPIGSSFTRRTRNLLGIWRNSAYVTLSSPLLTDGDALGFPFGFAKSGVDFATQWTKSMLSGGRWYGWAFYYPHAGLMQQIGDYLESGKLKPVIDEIFDYQELPLALEKVGQGHGRGKTVIRVASE